MARLSLVYWLAIGASLATMLGFYGVRPEATLAKVVLSSAPAGALVAVVVMLGLAFNKLGQVEERIATRRLIVRHLPLAGLLSVASTASLVFIWNYEIDADENEASQQGTDLTAPDGPVREPPSPDGPATTQTSSESDGAEFAWSVDGPSPREVELDGLLYQDALVLSPNSGEGSEPDLALIESSTPATHLSALVGLTGITNEQTTLQLTLSTVDGEVLYSATYSELVAQCLDLEFPPAALLRLEVDEVGSSEAVHSVSLVLADLQLSVGASDAGCSS